MSFEEDIGDVRQNFRKQKERRGLKGYWFLIIFIIIISSTLYASVILRENLPPLPFLDNGNKNVTVPGTSITNKSMELN